MKAKGNLFDRIRNRLQADRAAIVIASLKKATHRQEISYRAAEEASALARHYRLQVRCAIREYRQWQADQAISEVLQSLKAKEGLMLHERARQWASLYLDAMRDYRDLIALSVQGNDETVPEDERLPAKGRNL